MALLGGSRAGSMGECDAQGQVRKSKRGPGRAVLPACVACPKQAHTTVGALLGGEGTIR